MTTTTTTTPSGPISPGAETDAKKPWYIRNLKWLFTLAVIVIITRWVGEYREEHKEELKARSEQLQAARERRLVGASPAVGQPDRRKVDPLAYNQKVVLRLNRYTSQTIKLGPGEAVFLDLYDPSLPPEKQVWGVNFALGSIEPTLKYQRVSVDINGEPQATIDRPRIAYNNRTFGFDYKIPAQFIVTTREECELLLTLQTR